MLAPCYKTSSLAIDYHLHLCIHFIGISVISFSSLPECPTNGCANPMLLSTSLCIISGTLFTILGGLWPISYGWSRRNGRNYTMLGFLVWVGFVVFFCVAVALGIELYEHQDPLLPFVPGGLNCNGDLCRNITFVCDSAVEYCNVPHDYKLYVPMVTTGSMFSVISILIFLAHFVCAVLEKS